MSNIFKSGSQNNTTSTSQAPDHYNRVVNIIPNPYEKLDSDLNEIKAMLRSLMDNQSIVQEKCELIDIEEACELLKISRSTMYKMTAKNEIPTIRRPGSKKLIFSRLELDNWLKESQTSTMISIVDEHLHRNLRVRKMQNN